MKWKSLFAGMASGILVGLVTSTLCVVIFWWKSYPYNPKLVTFYSICFGTLPGALVGLLPGAIGGYLMGRKGKMTQAVKLGAILGFVFGLLAGGLGIVGSYLFSPN
jgi:hypothetical protein